MAPRRARGLHDGGAEPDPDVPLEPDSDGRYVLGRVWKYAEIGP